MTTAEDEDDADRSAVAAAVRKKRHATFRREARTPAADLADLLSFRLTKFELIEALDCAYLILREIAKAGSINERELRRIAEREIGVDIFEFQNVFDSIMATGIFGNEIDDEGEITA